jgi:hypothetical protein
MTILEFGNLKKPLIWGPPYDATIDINNVLFHHMVQQKKFINVLLQIQ